jgi:Na+-transporting NADH:ubiquinone oxidoreductase subunit NqrF
MSGDRHTCVVRGADGDIVVPVRDGALMISPFVGQIHPPIPVGCRGGGCGVCRVQVLAGEYQAKRMSQRFVSTDEARAGYALACRMIVTDDVVVRPCPPA